MTLVAIASAERRLTEWVATVAGLPFAWGYTDCGALAIHAQRIVGRRLPPIPRYGSLLEARAVWANLDLFAIGRQIHPFALEPGDVVWAPAAPLPGLYTLVGKLLLCSSIRHGVGFTALGPALTLPGAACVRFPDDRG